jgi:hypothetical protein
MRTRIPAAEFARRCGVSRAAVTKAKKAGNVIISRGLVDLRNKTNRLYMETQKERIGAPGPAPAGKKKRAALRGKDKESLSAQRMRADIALKQEMTATHQQRRLERLGLLVQKEQVDRRLAVLGNEIKVRLLDLPRRVFPTIAAHVKAGREPDGLALLEKEIGDAIAHVKKAAVKEVAKP